jgi:hypothetical protein
LQDTSATGPGWACRSPVAFWEDYIPDTMKAERCAAAEWTLAEEQYEVYEKCPLFIRKFKARTNETIYNLLYEMHII